MEWKPGHSQKYLGKATRVSNRFLVALYQDFQNTKARNKETLRKTQVQER